MLKQAEEGEERAPAAGLLARCGRDDGVVAERAEQRPWNLRGRHGHRHAPGDLPFEQVMEIVSSR
jgi:hypothetical protein